MLSKTSEYALRIMVLLARQNPLHFLKGEVIARNAQVPKAYLAKILQSLNRASLVCAQKGLGGGYALSKSATEISLFDVISAVDPFTRIIKCPLGIETHKTLCPLHKKLDNTHTELQKIFENCSLKELVQDKERSPLCVHENS